ncbi:MAG: AP endonuclease [Oscillospiraceae bacterium]|jgi:hypothetical protein|nr:AP endonuclease [Oscillospiraceae bacterium]
MSKIKISGVELEFNPLDADEVETYEAAIERVQKRTQEIKVDKSMKLSEGIRAICHEIFDCFNTVFGEGTDRKLFGNKTDMGACLSAFGELVQQTKAVGHEQMQEIYSKYLPNREFRRGAKK